MKETKLDVTQTQEIMNWSTCFQIIINHMFWPCWRLYILIWCRSPVGAWWESYFLSQYQCIFKQVGGENQDIEHWHSQYCSKAAPQKRIPWTKMNLEIIFRKLRPASKKGKILYDSSCTWWLRDKPKSVCTGTFIHPRAFPWKSDEKGPVWGPSVTKGQGRKK